MSTIPRRFFEPMPDPIDALRNTGILRIRVPSQSPAHGREFLQSVDGGSLLGAGRAASLDFIQLRSSYEVHAQALNEVVTSMRSQGLTEEQIARHVVAERTRFARSTRLRQGPAATVVLEVRDRVVYGLEGRSYQNMARRADAYLADARNATRKLDAPTTRESVLIKSALKPQELLQPKFLKAAKYLKYGGPIMLVLGAGLSAREIASASKEDRGRVAMEETGSFIGGELASEVDVLAILTWGTGGLGLLAIAGVALVGMAGGYGGHLLADRIYYSRHPHIVKQAQLTGQVHAQDIQRFLPMLSVPGQPAPGQPR